MSDRKDVALPAMSVHAVNSHPGRTLARCALALLLLAAHAVGAQVREPGYLYPAVALHIEAWLPPAPADDSMAKAADVETYLRTRALIGTARAEEAHADDVVKPAEKVAPRFTYLLGVSLDRQNAPKFLHMMDLVRNDLEWLLAPVKQDVGKGGRHRPFVEYPQLPKCEFVTPGLADTGSYPSGHATTGWLWGSILAEIAPQFADQLLARAIAFGDSRVVCGFHYPTDVVAGRLAAAALLDRLHADPVFLKDLADAKKEVTALLARSQAARTH
jgi:acid phosphatase (class A)